MDDRKVVQCNYAEDTNSVAKGARAYVVNPNNGNGAERIVVLARSRGGRWIETWEATSRLTDFRAKTLPPEHPMYDRGLLPAEYAGILFSNLAPSQVMSAGSGPQ